MHLFFFLVVVGVLVECLCLVRLRRGGGGGGGRWGGGGGEVCLLSRIVQV